MMQNDSAQVLARANHFTDFISSRGHLILTWTFLFDLFALKINSVKTDRPGKMSSVPGPLPKDLLGAYAQGKATTKVFSDWIRRHASVAVKNQYSTMVKKSNKKQRRTRGDDDNSTRPRQYLPFTRDILQQPSLKVPVEILDALDKCIHFRKKCIQWFSRYTDPEVVDSNERHQYFVQVLETVQSLLLPHAIPVEETNEPKKAEDEIAALTAKMMNVSGRTRGKARRKPTVTPEDVTESDAELDTALDQAIDPLDDDQTNTTNPGDRDAARQKYRRLVAERCLLEDVTSIWKYVISRWKTVDDGILEPHIAAASTNTAIALVEQLEESFIVSTQQDTRDDAEHLYPEQLSSSPENATQNPVDEEAEFPFRAAYGLCRALIDRRRKYVKPKTVSSDKQGCYDANYSSTALLHCPMTLMPYAVTETADRASPEPAVFGYREEDLGTFDRLFETTLGPCTDDKSKLCHFQPEDGVICALRRAVLSDRVSLSASFALGMLAALMKISKGREYDMLERVDQAANELIDFVKSERYQWKAVSVDIEAEPVKSMIDRYNKWAVWAGHILKGGPDYRSQNVPDGTRPVQTGIRQFILANPLACANLELTLRIIRADSSLEGVDCRSLLKTSLHFYNAARMARDLDVDWIDIEHVIELNRHPQHGHQELFLANERPASREQCLNILRLVCAIPINMGNIFRGRGRIRSPKERGFFMGTNTWVMIRLIEDQLHKCHLPASSMSVENLELVLAGIAKGEKDVIKPQPGRRLVIDAPRLWKLVSRKPRPTPCEVLAALESQLSLELTQALFDYQKLERICCTVANAIHERYTDEGIYGKCLKLPDELSVEESVLIYPFIQHVDGKDGIRNCKSHKLCRNLWCDRNSVPYATTVSVIAELLETHTDVCAKKFEVAKAARFLSPREQSDEVRGSAADEGAE